MSAEQRLNQTRLERIVINLIAGDPADTYELGMRLFELSDVLADTPPLLRALTDPGRTPSDRVSLALDVLEDSLSPLGMAIVAKSVMQHWARPEDLVVTMQHLGLLGVLHGSGERGELSSLSEELFGITETLRANRELRVALSDIGPLNDEQQAELVDRIFADSLTGTALWLVQRAVSQAQHGELMSLLRRYSETAARIQGTQLVTMLSATELTEAQRQRFERMLEKRIGEPVTLAVAVDSSLVGGFRLQYADSGADASISTELERARRALAA